MKNLKVILVLAILIASFTNLSANTGWNKVYIPIKANIGNLEFLNANFGVITTDKNDILVTYDGGNTFVNKTNCLFDTSKYIRQVKIKCENEIYLIYNNKLYLSTDQCCTWQKAKIDSKNDSLNIWEIAIFDDKYLCMTSQGLYTYNGCKWENIIKYSDLLNGANGLSDFKFLSQNIFIICTRQSQVLCGGSHSDYYRDNLYSISNNKVTLINSEYSSYYPSMRPYFDDKIIQIGSKLISVKNGTVEISYDYGMNWEYLWEDYYSIRQNISINRIYMIRNNSFYVHSDYQRETEQIFKLLDTTLIPCNIDTCGDYNLESIKVINDQLAFAKLSQYYYYDKASDITNYFLKTIDGGGVSATSVESDEIKSSIKESNELHLIDMLGKEIRSYDNYYKFEINKPNLAPPFLIKWKDSKGLYHFQKL